MLIVVPNGRRFDDDRRHREERDKRNKEDRRLQAEAEEKLTPEQRAAWQKELMRRL